MSRKGISKALGLIHPVTLSHGKNAIVWDVDGKEYIDFVGGIGVLNFGHCHPKIVTAINDQASKLTHYAFNAAEHEPYKKLAVALTDFVPIDGDLSLMLTNCGAESTENALKIARIKTGRTAVIAFDGGFHGRTLATVNLNGKVAPYKQKLGPLPGPVYHIPYPSKDSGVTKDEAISALKRLLEIEVDVKNVCAVIVEPVIGEGGFQCLDMEFAKYLREFCTENGIVLIFDEIQSGFGRTGKPFAFMHFDVQPDLLLLAKSIAGGLPLGAVVGRTEFVDTPHLGSLGGTYSGNPIACSAALAVLEIIQSEEFAKTSQNYIATLEVVYKKWKSSNINPWISKLTGIGAMRGIELSHPEYGPGTALLAEILKLGRERGLLLMPSGKYKNTIRLLTPLTIEPDVLDRGFEILTSIFADTAKFKP
ncbi:putative 4-aminobutyrate aminotransferase [Taylorella equigenitalis 14/56]|uniref:Putative 4-aminobutyrate aminotransferase n=1 Tax=Taylorella equigenitalis 14/56 TaxID=1091497 RepID=I7IJW8_9BURK|nr:aspartate aminotransferase family protein [Taylorella equigenitalis]CCG18686.1 putative 4-aminobutyrate aminotransferase [Taylorella equigenitalis 14/56]